MVSPCECNELHILSPLVLSTVVHACSLKAAEARNPHPLYKRFDPQQRNAYSSSETLISDFFF